MANTLYSSDKRPSGTSDVKLAEKSISSALKYDVDTLYKQFATGDNQSLARFGELFSEMEFNTIFIGRFSNMDLIEFSENLFHYVASYMFGSLRHKPLPKYIEGEVTKSKLMELFPERPDSSETRRIFGIFLAYSLYFLQPTQFVIPIFVTVCQIEDLYEFMDTVLLPEEYFEPLYCLYRLIQSNAFTIYPFDGSFNPMLYRRFDLFENDTLEAENRHLVNLEDLGHLHSLANDSIMAQAEALHSRYMQEKRGSAELLPQSALASKDSPIQLIKRLIKETESALKQRRTLDGTHAHELSAASSSLMSQIKEEAADNSQHPKTLLSRRNKIREQAYAGAVPVRRDRRHRMANGEDAFDDFIFEENLEAAPAPSSSSASNSAPIKKNVTKQRSNEVKKETAERELEKPFKRRRSRSRTLEFDEGQLDAREVSILHEIEHEIQTETPTKAPNSEPNTSTSFDEEPDQTDNEELRESFARKIEEMENDEAETEKLWQRIVSGRKH